MTVDLITHRTNVKANTIYLNAFAGGEHGRCVQLTIAHNGYAQMTFKEAVDLFKTCIAEIEKLNEEYNKKPPFWEVLGKGEKKEGSSNV